MNNVLASKLISCKLVDTYVGKKFGRLTVLSIAEQSTFAHSTVLCKCDCGTLYTAGCRFLGKTVFSCGCYHRDRMKELAIGRADKFSIGEQVSIFTVKKELGYSSFKRGIVYECECDCGTVQEFSSKYLGRVRKLNKKLRCRHASLFRSDNDRIPDSIRFACYKFFENKCVLCGSMDRPEVDHVLARALSGESFPGNLVVLCAECNYKKGKKSLDELPYDDRNTLEFGASAFELWYKENIASPIWT